MVTDAIDRPATRLATRLAFVAAGFAMAAWAPLVPFAKARVGVDEAQLGLLLLCLGIGSIIAMPATGMLSARFGARPMILLGGIGVALLLPALAIADTPVLLGVALLLFGASLGTLDVAANAHAVEIESAAGTPLMSGFHAMFSIGGFAGAGGTTLMLALGASPWIAAAAVAVLALAVIALAAPRLLRTAGGAGSVLFAFPTGVVLLLAALAAATFLAEGALLDWSALLITRKNLVPPALGGLGYMLFSAAMTLGRLTGDRVVAWLGPRKVLVVGGGVAVVGFVVLLAAPWSVVAMSGFLLIGMGAANMVPIFFSAAGRQNAMSPPLAVAAITTTGYAGILAGPAVLGFVAHATSLTTAFVLLAVLLTAVPLLSGRVVRQPA